MREVYQKRRERDKKSKAFWNGLYRKSLSRYKKLSRQKEAERKRRMKEYTKERDRRQNTQQNNEPITAKDIAIFIVLGVVGYIVIELLVNFGIKSLFSGIVFGIIGIVVVTLAVIIIKSTMETVSEQKQIKYYESLLPQIDECKEIINNSSDAQAVKENLDKLLTIMDEIIDAPEELLNKAGMTNRTMQQQKENVLNNYDILIKQAEESTL